MKKENQNIFNVFEKSTEITGAFQIFLSPFLIAAIVAAFIYFSNPNNTLTLIIAAAILALGTILGIKLALKIYKSKEGTIHFISRTDATPEIDEVLNKKEEKNDHR